MGQLGDDWMHGDVGAVDVGEGDLYAGRDAGSDGERDDDDPAVDEAESPGKAMVSLRQTQ